VEVLYTDHRTGTKHTTKVRVTECVACAPGYRLILDEQEVGRLPSFGNWIGSGHDQVQIRVAVRDVQYSPGNLMLNLLCSGNGRGGTWNNLPFGAGLDPDTEVDRNSFLRATQATDGWWVMHMPEGETLVDLLKPLLLVTSSALVMKRDGQGKCRLALVPVTPESNCEVVAELDRFQWGSQPVASTVEEVVTTFAFKLNYDEDGTAGLAVRVQDSGGLAAGNRDETLDLDLRGLQVFVPRGGDPLDAVLPIASRLSRLYAQPRRTFYCRVPSAEALAATLGSVIEVSNPNAKGAGDKWGLDKIIGRVVAIRPGVWEEGTTLRVVSYGVRPRGWAPSAKILSNDGPVCTVAANEYCETTNPVTGAVQKDMDGFQVGDVVRYVNLSNQGVYTVMTIVAMDREANTITLDQTPAPGGYRWIQPPSFRMAATRFQQYAFLGNTDGTLGESSQAQEIG